MEIDRTRNIGLIGIGLIGAVLAKRLLAEGFGVLVPTEPMN